MVSSSFLSAPQANSSDQKSPPLESSKSFSPLPILKQHSSNLGFVTCTLASTPDRISKLELKRWLKKQTFDQSQLDIFVKAVQQPDWASAIAVVNQAGGNAQSGLNSVPSSILAELATKKIGTHNELDQLLTIVGHRIAVEDKTLVACQLLNGALQASLSMGNLVAAGELVDYSIRFSNEIARVEIEKQFSLSAGRQPSKNGILAQQHCEPDPSLALRPLIACIAALMNQKASKSRNPIFRFLGQLISVILKLSGGLGSAFSRMSRPNIHLLCRAMISSALSSDGYPLRPEHVELILKQNLPVSTLRLAMLVMIQCGDRQRATEIELLIRASDDGKRLENSKYQLDLSFQQVRRVKEKAYSQSDKLHQLILPKLISMGDGFSGRSIESYTMYMSALHRHHLPKMALKVWEQILQMGVLPDAAAIQVAMAVYIDLNRPMEAVFLFNRFSKPRRLDQADNTSPCIGTTNSPSLQVLATFARALDLSGSYLEVYQLWKNIWIDWAVQPDERIFGALISSARKLSLVHLGHPTHAMLRSLEPMTKYEASPGENLWDGEPAGELALRMFWSILYHNWPTVARTLRVPLRKGSNWISSSAYDIFLGRLRHSTSPGCFIAQPRRGPSVESHESMATTVMPSLGFATEYSSIVPNRSTCKDIVELLGLQDQARLVPLVLSWMEALRISPNQDLVLRAYYWIYQSDCPPMLDRLTSLDEFVTSWFQREGCQDRVKIPTQEMMEEHYHFRSKWTKGFFYRS